MEKDDSANHDQFTNAAETARALQPEAVESAPDEMEQAGLALANEDERRAIYTIVDQGSFLDPRTSPIPPSLMAQTKDLFDRYPEGLKQWFVKKSEGPAVLAKHYHTDLEGGGTGDEAFLFNIPSGSSVTSEQYELGRAQGRIRYSIPSGTEVLNKPDTYHVFRIDGPVSFVQVLENSEFVHDDLVSFDSKDWSAEDSRMVNGTMPWPKES